MYFPFPLSRDTPCIQFLLTVHEEIDDSVVVNYFDEYLSSCIR